MLAPFRPLPIALSGILTLGVLLAGATAPAAAAAPQDAPRRTVHDGVFSETQSDRGRSHYEATCQRCHGADLVGGRARPLAGEAFLRNWLGLTLDGLFGQLNTMPPSAAASGMLGNDVYLDILSFILARNGFPSGPDDLTVAMLGDVRIEGEHGPQPVPDHTLVHVVGCLTEPDERTWMVTDASEPVRTRDPNATTGADRQHAETRALGTGSFQLLYVFPSPEALVGHRVEVKGFLIRGDQDALNVTAIDSLASPCSPTP